MMTDSSSDKNGLGLPPGTRIGKYEVIEMLGAGGQSVVYRCHDSLLDRDVAAKQISAHLAGNPEFMEHFRQEARTLARVGADQPGIVTIHDLVEDENGLFIVMEFVEGMTLEAMLLSPEAPMATKPATQLLWRLAGAMAAVHQAGIVHRDLKPSNIIVAEGLKPKITDFGVATSVSGQTSMVMGTTKYMAPELFEGAGQGDGRSDIYSLGLIMYELLLGREKFNEIFGDVVRDPRTAPVRWMKWHGNAAVQAPALHVVNPSIPEPLSNIIATMLAKDPAQRYPTMEALGVALRQDLAGVELSESPSVSSPRRPEPMLEAELVEAEAVVPAGPSREQLEAAPTMPLPRSTMTSRQRLMLICVVVILVIGAGITLGVMRHQKRKSQLDDLRRIYTSAVSDYDRMAYAEARDGFGRVIAREPESLRARQSRVYEAMASAQLALAERDWPQCNQFEDAAEAALVVVEQGASERLQEWVDERRRDIEEIAGRRRLNRLYYQRLDEITHLADTGQYEQAVTLLENFVGAQNLPFDMKAELDDLERDIHIRWIRDQVEVLQTDIEEAISLGDGHGAILNLNELNALILRDRVIEYIDREQRDQWRDWVTEQRAAVGALERIRELETIISQARPRNQDAIELEALRELATLLPPGEALDTCEARILELSIRIAFAEAQQIEDQGNLPEAELAYARVLQMSGGAHEPSRLALERLQARREVQDLWTQADTLYRNGDWAGAQAIYQDIVDRNGDTNAIEQVRRCRFNIHLDEGDALRDQNDLTAAAEEYAQAAAVAVDAEQSAAVASRQDELARLERLKAADREIAEQIERRNWQDALDTIEAALEDCVTADERDHMEYQRLEVLYQKHLHLGLQEMSAARYSQAVFWFDEAREYRVEQDGDTAEVDALIEEAAEHLDDSGDA